MPPQIVRSLFPRTGGLPPVLVEGSNGRSLRHLSDVVLAETSPVNKLPNQGSRYCILGNIGSAAVRRNPIIDARPKLLFICSQLVLQYVAPHRPAIGRTINRMGDSCAQNTAVMQVEDVSTVVTNGSACRASNQFPAFTFAKGFMIGPCRGGVLTHPPAIQSAVDRQRASPAGRDPNYRYG